MVNILIGLVIAMFLIVAVFVGYNASQSANEEMGGHSITIEPISLETTPQVLEIIENQGTLRAII